MGFQINLVVAMFFLGMTVTSCSEKNVHNEDEQAQNRNNYNSLIAKADHQFQDENWVDAEKTYNEAIRLLPKEDYPRDKLQECKFMIKISTAGSTVEVCKQMTSAADKLFTEKRYYRAREMYGRVSNNCFLDSSYINHQLERIKDSLH